MSVIKSILGIKGTPIMSTGDFLNEAAILKKVRFNSFSTDDISTALLMSSMLLSKLPWVGNQPTQHTMMLSAVVDIFSLPVADDGYKYEMNFRTYSEAIGGGGTLLNKYGFAAIIPGESLLLVDHDTLDVFSVVEYCGMSDKYRMIFLTKEGIDVNVHPRLKVISERPVGRNPKLITQLYTFVRSGLSIYQSSTCTKWYEPHPDILDAVVLLAEHILDNGLINKPSTTQTASQDMLSTVTLDSITLQYKQPSAASTQESSAYLELKNRYSILDGMPVGVYNCIQHLINLSGADTTGVASLWSSS